MPMQMGTITLTAAPQLVPIKGVLNSGLRLIGRSANSGTSYSTMSSAATAGDSTCNTIPKGDPASTLVYTVPPGQYDVPQQYIYVFGTAGDKVEWSGS